MYLFIEFAIDITSHQLNRTQFKNTAVNIEISWNFAILIRYCAVERYAHQSATNRIVPDGANFMFCDWLFSNIHCLKTIDILRFCYYIFNLFFCEEHVPAWIRTGSCANSDTPCIYFWYIYIYIYTYIYIYIRCTTLLPPFFLKFEALL